MRIATGMIEGLHYKLRMFGILIEGATDHVSCNNKGVISNSSKPESQSTK